MGKTKPRELYSYTFGFNGQEKDNEIKGAGNSVNFKYRMEDTRLGRFFAVDPLARAFPWNSSYAFAENRVIDGVEFEGLEVVLVNPTDDKIIHEVGSKDNDENSINIYAHGDPSKMVNSLTGENIKTPQALNKLLTKESKQWRDRKKEGTTIIILHSCRTGKTTIDSKGRKVNSLAQNVSNNKEFNNDIIIAPDERDVFTDLGFYSYEKGPREADCQDANGVRCDPTSHATSNKKGSWIVYKNGKEIDRLDGNSDPHDYTPPQEVNNSSAGENFNPTEMSDK